MRNRRGARAAIQPKGTHEDFCARGVALVEELPRGRSADSIGNQLLVRDLSRRKLPCACTRDPKREFRCKLASWRRKQMSRQFWMDLIIAVLGGYRPGYKVER